ncbi:hypothetical protein OLX02_14675 [Novosphingobium sp. KCTC 2891]|uniref:anti-sigma factor family protein n=1 Tax=Novosphingobium sp. KCTC 2891 TaxID=2989730 RepID=UPI002222D21B|nr:hypothetical protein [Novosphingobium sp. KCTC 2891]MCW1384065.1 hypothetical protein [Novosphingobium sp. KCTC 2891]
MIPTPEQIAAFADNELEGEERAQVAAAVAGSPQFQAQVSAHRRLRERLAGHFGGVIDEPLPAALTRQLAGTNDVIDLAAARRRRTARWAWAAVPALAASVALVVMLRPALQDDPLTAMLDHQLVAEQGAGPSRILLSFRAGDGRFCRAYALAGSTRIACRDREGWKIEGTGKAAQDHGDYRQAGSAAEVMQQAQQMAAGPALTATEEERARATGWLPDR